MTPSQPGCGVSEEWIVSRTGIHQRRIAQPGTSVCELAAEAGRRALARAEVKPSDVDLILVASSSAESVVPNTAPLVADLIGANAAFAVDVGAACSGWVAALSLAAGQLESGRAGTALVIGAEIMSRLLDLEDRITAPLFGDGAGAAVMQAASPRAAIGPFVFGSDASGADSIVIRRDENRVRMDGINTFKHAVRRLSEATIDALGAERSPDRRDRPLRLSPGQREDPPGRGRTARASRRPSPGCRRYLWQHLGGLGADCAGRRRTSRSPSSRRDGAGRGLRCRLHLGSRCPRMERAAVGR